GHGRAAVVYVQDGEPAAFGRDVEPVRAGVVGDHVGVLPDGMAVEDLPGVQVDGEQDGVAVAGNECQPVGVVDSQPVVVVAAWQFDAAGDAGGGGVDDDEEVAGLDGDEHLPAGRVVGDVAGFTAHVDGAARRGGCGVQ